MSRSARFTLPSFLIGVVMISLSLCLIFASIRCQKQTRYEPALPIMGCHDATF